MNQHFKFVYAYMECLCCFARTVGSGSTTFQLELESKFLG